MVEKKIPYLDENGNLVKLTDFAGKKLNSELYGFPFRWEDYDAFKDKIDKAYEEYRLNSTNKA